MRQNGMVSIRIVDVVGGRVDLVDSYVQMGIVRVAMKNGNSLKILKAQRLAKLLLDVMQGGFVRIIFEGNKQMVHLGRFG